MKKPLRDLLHGLVLVLCCAATLGVVAFFTVPRSAEELSSGQLWDLRREASESAVRRSLRDPDSGEFQFEESGEDTLRVRVRAENAFGGHVVQRFEITFRPGSAAAVHVFELP